MKPQPGKSALKPLVLCILAVATIAVLTLIAARYAPLEWRVRASLPDDQLAYLRVEHPDGGSTRLDVGVEIDNALDAASVPYEVARAGYSVAAWVFIDRRVETLRIQYSVHGQPAVVVTHARGPGAFGLLLPRSGWYSEPETIEYFAQAASYEWVNRQLWSEATATGDGAMIAGDDLAAERGAR